MTKTHFKKYFHPDYIGAYILAPGEEKVVKITHVKTESVTGTNGKKQDCMVAYLEGEKPFILNRTNCKTIAKVYNSPYVEDWAGKLITIYAAKVSAFGEDVEALRIRQAKPQQGRRIDSTAQSEALRICETLEQLQSVYIAFTPEQKAATLTIKDEMKAKLMKGGQE